MATITYLTRIEFDHGAVATLPDLLRGLGIHAPLLVTDRGVIGAGLLDRVRAGLGDAAVFADTPSNPTEEATLAALDLYRSAGCDGLVAVGGGSPIDLAKAVALLATHPAPLAQYAAIDGGIERIGPTAPLIAVPTTAGTGSEVGRAALITLADGRKLGLISPHLIPRIALCDPELTLGLPPYLTAATGLDAISHCVETYLSPRVNPVAEAIALDGLERAVTHIERAVADGSDRDARWQMMMAALQGGLTFQKGLGAIHALSHPLGGLKRISLHHGTLNAILLPHVLDWNAPACTDKYAAIRKRLGLAPDAPLSAWFAALNARLGLPATLAQVGVTPEDLSGIAEAATRDHSSATNPRPTSAAEYRALLDTAMQAPGG
jgi:alcohol dehydrogenase class IV